MSGSLRHVQALVVVDVQAAFVCGDHAVPAAAALLAAVTGLADRARHAGALIVQLQNDGPPGAPDEPHTPGWELFLAPAGRPAEYVIRKDTDDGFHQTGLAAVLDGHGVRHLAVAGVMSEMCVSVTTRSALSRGYRVVLPHDGHATCDIPAASGLAAAVPHVMVSRVAEWALGDQADIIARAADVRFTPPDQ
jgi:nicotinamidase-related amidase